MRLFLSLMIASVVAVSGCGSEVASPDDTTGGRQVGGSSKDPHANAAFAATDGTTSEVSPPEAGLKLTGGDLRLKLYRDYRAVAAGDGGTKYHTFCVNPIAAETELGTVMCGARAETKQKLTARHVYQECSLDGATSPAEARVAIACNPDEKLALVLKVSTPALCLRVNSRGCVYTTVKP